MNCPVCKAEMEGEQVREVTHAASPGTCDGEITARPYNGVLDRNPVIHFYCESCDSEWVLRRKKFRLLDGGDTIPLDRIIRSENHN